MKFLLAIFLLSLSAVGATRLVDCKKTEAILAAMEGREGAVEALFAYLTHDIRGMSDADLELYLSQPSLVNPVPFASQVSDTQRHVVGNAFRDELKGMDEEEKLHLWEKLRTDIRREANELKKEKEKREEVNAKTEAVIQPIIKRSLEWSAHYENAGQLYSHKGKEFIAIPLNGSGLGIIDLSTGDETYVGASKYFGPVRFHYFNDNGTGYLSYLYEGKVSFVALDPVPHYVDWSHNDPQFESVIGYSVLNKNGKAVLLVQKKSGHRSFLMSIDQRRNVLGFRSGMESNESADDPLLVQFKGRTFLPGTREENSVSSPVLIDLETGNAEPSTQITSPKSKALQIPNQKEILFIHPEGIYTQSLEGNGKQNLIDNSFRFMVGTTLSKVEDQGKTYGVALGSVRSAPNQEAVVVVDLEDKTIQTIPASKVKGPISSFSHDGKTYLVWGTASGELEIADLNERRVIARATIGSGVGNVTILPYSTADGVSAIVGLGRQLKVVQLVGPLPGKAVKGDKP